MRRITAFALCALAVAGPLATPPPAGAGADDAAIDELNQIRHAYGLRALQPSASLHRSASRYAATMLRRDYFGHGARIGVAARFHAAGETLAWHTGLAPAPRRTVHQWMASPPHRALLLSPRFRFVGMGFARGRLGSQLGTAWVAHVGAY